MAKNKRKETLRERYTHELANDLRSIMALSGEVGFGNDPREIYKRKPTIRNLWHWGKEPYNYDIVGEFGEELADAINTRFERIQGLIDDAYEDGVFKGRLTKAKLIHRELKVLMGIRTHGTWEEGVKEELMRIADTYQAKTKKDNKTPLGGSLEGGLSKFILIGGVLLFLSFILLRVNITGNIIQNPVSQPAFGSALVFLILVSAGICFFFKRAKTPS